MNFFGAKVVPFRRVSLGGSFYGLFFKVEVVGVVAAGVSNAVLFLKALFVVVGRVIKLLPVSLLGGFQVYLGGRAVLVGRFRDYKGGALV